MDNVFQANALQFCQHMWAIAGGTTTLDDAMAVGTQAVS
jgi:hypothetical protein